MGGTWRTERCWAGEATIGFAFIRALGQWKAILVFPTTSIGTILLTSLTATVLWRERYCRRSLWGMGLAAAALVLLNWK